MFVASVWYSLGFCGYVFFLFCSFSSFVVYDFYIQNGLWGFQYVHLCVCVSESVKRRVSWPCHLGEIGLNEVSWVLESSGQDSCCQGVVTSSKFTSQLHALLKVTELKINMEPVIAFSLDVLFHMFHTLNSFASLLYSSRSLRTNIEVGRGDGE